MEGGAHRMAPSPRVERSTRYAVIAVVAAAQLVFASPTHAEEIARDSAAWPIAHALIASERTAWDVYARRDLAAPDLLSSDYVDLLPGGEINGRAGHLAAIAEADLPSYSLDGLWVMRQNVDAMRVTIMRPTGPTGPAKRGGSRSHQAGRCATASG